MTTQFRHRPSLSSLSPASILVTSKQYYFLHTRLLEATPHDVGGSTLTFDTLLSVLHEVSLTSFSPSKDVPLKARRASSVLRIEIALLLHSLSYPGFFPLSLDDGYLEIEEMFLGLP